MNVNISFLEEINIVIESGLTPTELFVIRLIFLGLDGDPSPLRNYVENIPNGRGLIREVIKSLMSKKIINSTYQIPDESSPIIISNIPFNKNFIKKYIKESNELGKEFFYEYPDFTNINGKLVSIKNFTKANLFSLDDFCRFYTKSIKSQSVTHERVMSALRFGKDNNLIHYSILEFIASMKYLEIEKLRDSGDLNGYSNSELI